MVKVNDKSDEMPHSRHGPPSSLNSDGSFVVLERSPHQEPDVNQFSNCAPHTQHGFPTGSDISGHQLDSQSSTFLPGSMSCDLSPEEIQRKLHELLQENIELKETLHQNNLAMKQQFNTLVMWQDEVFKVHQSHKEKFSETKDLILKLRAENAELKNYLDQSKTGSVSDTQLKSENAKLKGQIAELQQKLSAPMPRKDHPNSLPSKKEEELSELVKQLTTKLETAERARRQLIVDTERLTAQRTRLERDVTTLKVELESHKERNQILMQEKEELTKKQDFVVVDRQRYEQSAEFKHLKEELEQERSQRMALQLQLEKENAVKEVQQQSSFACAPTQTAHSKNPGEFSNNLKSYEEKLQQFNTSLEKQSERFASLDSWLQIAGENVNQWKGNQTANSLKAEFSELRKVLAKEQAYSEEKKKHLADAAVQLQSLFTDYQSLFEEWESYHQEQTNKAHHNDAYHDLQTKGFSEKLDGLTAQLLCKDEELTEKTKEVTQLKEKVKKLEVENEAITILKAQVEVYQSDFNAERAARENLAGERERLSEDLRHLQRRNQQLLDEIENIRRTQVDQLQNRSTVPNFLNSGWSTIGTPGRVSSNGRVQRSPAPEEQPQRVYDEEIPPPKEFSCPVCQMVFRQLSLLEYHIETCLGSQS